MHLQLDQLILYMETIHFLGVGVVKKMPGIQPPTNVMDEDRATQPKIPSKHSPIQTAYVPTI